MNNNEYNYLYDGVENWLNRKEDYQLRKNLVFGIRPKYYFILFIILFAYVFYFKKDGDSLVLNMKDSKETHSVLSEMRISQSTFLLEQFHNGGVTILDESKNLYKP